MAVRVFRCATLLALAASLQVAALMAAGGAELKPPLSVQWVCSMGADPNNKAPVIASGRVYVVNDGVLHSLDAVTGAEEWKFGAKEVRVTTGPVAVQDLIVVGADDSGLYGLKASDGKQAWRQTLAGPLRADPLLLGELLIVGAQDMVYAIVPSSGQPKWVCSLTAPVSETPVADGSMVYFLCQDGSLQCVDAEAERYRWTAPLRTGPNAFPPVLAGRRVIVASGKTLVAVSRSGAVTWSAQMPVGIGGPPSVVDDLLYVPGVDGLVYVLLGRSGRAQRSVRLQVMGAATAPPLLAGRAVYAGTGNSLVYALDRDSGTELWCYRCIAPDQGLDEASTYGIYTAIVAAGGSLYVLTGDGDLYCFTSSAPDPAGPMFSSLRPEPGDGLSSKVTPEISFAVTDGGTGVDPATIQVTVDGTPMDVELEVASGVGVVRPASLKEGPHIVKATAKDYRGNSGSIEWSFLTDSSIAAPPEAERPSMMRQRGTVTSGTLRGRTAAQPR